MDQKHETLTQWFVGSTVASLICCLLFYPLECVEGVLQISKGRRNVGFFNTMQSMVTSEGVGSLFKGVIPAILGAGFGGGCYFTSYQWARSFLVGHLEGTTAQFMAGIFAGFVASFIANPFLVWKMRTLNVKGSSSQSGLELTFQVLNSILKHDGFLALWNGIGPSLLGVFEGAIQLVVYDFMNTIYYSSFINGALSKVVAILFTYPYQFLRSRMQADSSYRSLGDCVSKVYTNEGFFTFYTGMVPNIMRSLLPNAIFFYLFEFIKRLLQ